MVLTLAPPHLWVKVVKLCRKSNARAIWSEAASGMLEGRGLLFPIRESDRRCQWLPLV